LKIAGSITGQHIKNEAYEVKNFLYESGLYYEKLRKLYQAESSWKLVINIDIGSINKRIHTLQDYIDHAHHLCKIQIESKMYENMKQLLEIIILANRINIIYQTTQNKKRGLIDGIGSIAKAFFGCIMNASNKKIIKLRF